VQQRIVTDLVDDALQNGAHAAAGGRPHDGEGFFYRPTILSNLDDGTRIVAEEQFGPALPVRPPEVTAFLAARTKRLRFRGDQAMATQCAGQPPDQRGEHSPVRPVQARPRVGAMQDGDLMPQHEELNVLNGGRAAHQQDQSEHLPKDQIQ